MDPSKNILDEFVALLGESGVLHDDAAKVPFMAEWRGRLQGKTAAVLLPQNAAQVAEIVKLCRKHKTALAPQGGNTGLVGASIPVAGNPALCLSLKRMNKIRNLDTADFSMVAEAGCILQNVQEAALNEGRFFPMTLASEGSATIGGLVATNAGGSLTIRYGNMREQILGMEAVLPDGTLWNGLRSLRKNNSGYDMKQLLIGSEGTLGIITAVCLRLLPKPAERKTAMIALASPEAAIAALSALREKTGDTIAAFELMPQIAIDSAVKFLGEKKPFAKDHPWAALIETHESDSDTRLETALAQLIEQGVLLDTALAKNVSDRQALWTLREAIVEAQKRLGASLKHDIAVPVGQMTRFIAEGSKLVEKTIPGARVYAFGHAGDGNIHFNLSQPEGGDEAAFLARRDSMAAALHDLALKLGGSISAEHGIGRFKRAEFLRTAALGEIEAMRKIKKALDPDNILNPGVLF